MIPSLLEKKLDDELKEIERIFSRDREKVNYLKAILLRIKRNLEEVYRQIDKRKLNDKELSEITLKLLEKGDYGSLYWLLKAILTAIDKQYYYTLLDLSNKLLKRNFILEDLAISTETTLRAGVFEEFLSNLLHLLEKNDIAASVFVYSAYLTIVPNYLEFPFLLLEDIDFTNLNLRSDIFLKYFSNREFTNTLIELTNILEQYFLNISKRSKLWKEITQKEMEKLREEARKYTFSLASDFTRYFIKSIKNLSIFDRDKFSIIYINTTKRMLELLRENKIDSSILEKYFELSYYASNHDIFLEFNKIFTYLAEKNDQENIVILDNILKFLININKDKNVINYIKNTKDPLPLQIEKLKLKYYLERYFDLKDGPLNLDELIENLEKKQN